MANFKSEPVQDSSRRKDKITGLIKDVLDKYGYMQLRLPTCEQYDLLKDTAYNFSDENTVRFVDNNTGKMLVLRPDFTPQVCRAVLGYMSDYPLPLRISYQGAVYRTVDMDRGHKSEKYQLGWELFGGSELCGDTEMILVTDRALKSIGLNDHQLVVSDAMLLSRILELAGEHADELKNILRNKHQFMLKTYAEKLACDNLAKLVKALPLAFGSISLIDELRELCEFDNLLLERLDYLDNLFNRLKLLEVDVDNLVFDLSDAKGLDYYTGIMFEIIHEDAGFSLGGGGRYDTLLSKFGTDAAACGMALNIDEIMQFEICLDSGVGFDYLITGFDNIKLAEELRHEGSSVLFLEDKNKAQEFLKIYKFKKVIDGGTT